MLETFSGSVVTAADLARAGLDQNDVVRLRREGRLVRLYHRTYGVPPLTEPAFATACRGAVRYAGAGAVVVGESALALRSAYPAPDAPEVAVPRERYVVSTPGLVVRRLVGQWLVGEPVGGVCAQRPPVAVAWAWSRLRDRADRRAVLCEAVRVGAVATIDVLAAVRRLPRFAGRGTLVTDCAHVAAGCESPGEIEYLLDVERAFGLPRGERQATIAVPGGRHRRADVRYGRVLVEIDGAHHTARRDEDEARDVVLRALGYAVLRVPIDDVRRCPGLVAATVRATLAAHSSDPAR